MQFQDLNPQPRESVVLDLADAAFETDIQFFEHGLRGLEIRHDLSLSDIVTVQVEVAGVFGPTPTLSLHGRTCQLSQS